MKLYTMLSLLAFVVVAASPRTVVCRASGTPTPRPNCDPLALRPCAPVIWGEAPSAKCCARLRKQSPCLCKHRDNPYLSRFINSPDGMKIATACHLKALRC